MPKTTMYMGTCTILRHVGWDNQQNKLYSVIFQRILPSISPQIQAFPLPSTTTIFTRNWTCRSTHIDFQPTQLPCFVSNLQIVNTPKSLPTWIKITRFITRLHWRCTEYTSTSEQHATYLSNRQRKKLSVLQTNFHNPSPNQTFLVTG